MRPFLLLATILATALTSVTIASPAPDIPRTASLEQAAPPRAPGARPVRAGTKEPLRVFIRSGPKSHGPGAHDYPRFLKEWVPLLNERGAKAIGAEAFPTKAQLDQTDVLILHSQAAGTIKDATDRKNLSDFIARGGGVVVIHAAAVSEDPDWFKGIVGGSWRNGTTKWLEGPMHLYFTDRESPITTGASNWAMDDEIYYDMDVLPEARILATAYTPKPAGARNTASQKRADELTGGGKRVSIYDIQPQMWTYERTAEGGAAPYRAFVSIPGHFYENFNRTNYRAILLRGITWAGRRANVNELLKKEELGDGLRYVEGGPTAPDKAAAKIEVHPEFDLTLVAAEPLIQKAMNLDWDERGRLWVSETPEYPNGRRVPNTDLWKDSGSLRPARQTRDPEDTISILSDTNRDGVMDRKHVFADKLELVTGFVLYRTGVIAATSPDIWYLEDTNGDEVADKRTKLYTGLGTNDTHAVINNLRWGLDGWVYATHGYSTATVTSPDGKKSFGRDGSGVVRFKPDGTAFEQFSSRGGNTWGLDITWDGQVFWTQPTSGTVFFHTVLPESVLAKGRIPGTTSWKGMINRQPTYPLMTWPEQAYVQIDLVGEFTAAAGCAVYEGGAWPEQWRYAYFTGEPTLNIVHQQFVKPDGVSYTTQKETGREKTEFMRSKDLWFRPIETRVGPDGALYVIDFYNQAVIHNDTRGPLHGPANAAVRPDRDHYFGRIWRVHHKQAKKLAMPALNRRDLAGLIRAIQTNPNAHVAQTAWRLAQENHASDARLAQIKKPMGSKALQLYEQARAATTAAQRKTTLDAFTASADNWTKSALVAAATGQAPEYVADALTYARPDALTEFVTAILPAALPNHAGRLLVAAAGAGSNAGALKAGVVRAVARMEGGAIALDPATTQALQKLLDDPATSAAALPIVAKWDKAGVLSANAESRARVLLRELGTAATSDDRRADITASLLAIPANRPEALSTIARLLKEPGQSGRLIATLGESTGSDVDAVLVAALARNQLDAPCRRAAETPGVLAGAPCRHEGRDRHAGESRAGERRAAADPPGPAGGAAGRGAARHAVPGGEGEERHHRRAGAGGREARRRGEGQGPLHRRVLELPQAGRARKERGRSPAAERHRRTRPRRAVRRDHRSEPRSRSQFLAVERDDATGADARGRGRERERVGPHAAQRRRRRGDQEGRHRDAREHAPLAHARGARGARRRRAARHPQLPRRRRAEVPRRRSAAGVHGGQPRGFRREDERDETVTLHRFGDVSVAGVPFFVMDPARSPSGANLVALKGGPGRENLSDRFPQRVEIPTNATAASLHFLGGVGGWAWPTSPGGGEATRGTPVMKVTVHFADGTTEEHVLKNGEHFADTFVRADVPLSADAGDFTRRGQLRYFALNLGKKGALSKVVLESFDTDVVPATVAITAGAEPAVVKSSSGSTAGQAGTGREPARAERGRTRGRPVAGNEADRLGARQDEGPHHWRRRRAQLRAVLRRGRQRHSQRRRIQRELHRGPRSGRRGDRAPRCGGRQRQPAVLRHARLSQGAVRFRRGRKGPGDAAPRHVVRVRAMAGAERDHHRRRGAQSRSDREVLGQRGQAGSSDHEGRTRVVRGRGRALPPERGGGQDPAGHRAHRGAGRDVAERAVQAAASRRVGHPASQRPNRRHHAGSRSACARSPGVQDAADQRGEMGGTGAVTIERLISASAQTALTRIVQLTAREHSVTRLGVQGRR